MYRDEYALLVAKLEEEVRSLHRNDRRLVAEARDRVNDGDYITKSDLDELQDLVSQL